MVGLHQGMNDTKISAEELERVLRSSNKALEEGTAAYNNSVVAAQEYSKTIADTYQTKTANLELTQRYKDRLMELVDSNGNVAGSENEVKTILEELNAQLGTNFQLQDGHITQNGEVYDSYEELNSAIEENIKVLKRQAMQEIITDNYKEAMKFEKDYKKNMEEVAAARKKAIEEAHQVGLAYGFESDAYKQAMANEQELTKQQKTLWEQHGQYTQDIANYESDMAKTFDESADIIIDAETGKMEILSGTERQIRETMAMTQEQMIDLAKTSTEEWKAKYDQLNEDQKISMLAMSTTIETLSPTIISEWAKLAETSADRFSEEINWVPEDAKGAILASITTTESLTPTLAKEWESLASKSQSEFAAALQKVDPTTRKEILKSISTTQANIEKNRLTWQDFAKQCPDEYVAALSELDPATADAIKTVVSNLDQDVSVEQAYSNLGNRGTESYDKSVNAVAKWSGINEATLQKVRNWTGTLDVSSTTRNKGENNISSLSSGINSKSWLVNNAIATVRNYMNSVDSGLSPWTKAANFVQGLINGFNDKFPTLSRTVSSIATKVGKIFSGNWLERSPSRLAKQQGAYYVEGLEIGFENEENSLYKTVGKIADGVTVTMSDTLSGQTTNLTQAVQDNIQVQSTATISGTVQNNMKELIAEAVTNANVNVNIEAKTEEGVIVRKATDGINSYIRQTGEMPFPVLI